MTKDDKQFFAGLINGVDQKVSKLDARMNGLDKKMNGLDKKMDGLDKKMNGLDKKMDGLQFQVHKNGLDIEWLKDAFQSVAENNISLYRRVVVIEGLLNI